MAHDSAREFPFLPLRQGFVLPGAIAPIPIGRARSRALFDALSPGDRLVLGVQFAAEVDEPAIADLHALGVVAEVRDKAVRGSRGATLVVETYERVRLAEITRGRAFLQARVETVVERNADTPSARARADSLRAYLAELAGAAAALPELEHTHAPGLVADRVAGFVDAPHERKLEVLHALDVEARLVLVTALLHEARARAELREAIDSEVRKGLSEQQREVLLRQQLRAIQQQLGEAEDDDELGKLREQLAAAALPEEVRKVADRELKRLAGMQSGQPETHVIRSYLGWIAELPWTRRADVCQDIDAIAAALDADHHGLAEVKRRVLEHMAVLKLSARTRGTILALVGPPGVGKTSLAQSVARATGRPLARVSLGGVRDEAEIRGHRRTYVGALPGRILHALRKVGVKNPIMVLDEIDKLGRGWAGDPGAALLEVLDPEQNDTFTDHYLELPFDLSEVLFIATANELTSVPPALRDRLEVIEIHGYTVDEKVGIARDHLWPKQREEHGVARSPIELDDAILAQIARDYTREAGVRQLARELAKICRALALEVARTAGEPARIDAAALLRILGRPRFLAQLAEPQATPGVAAGLAWTPAGGDVLYVESTQMPGKGRLEITGQLGEVMTESARAALAYLRSHADELGVDPTFLERRDLHIHVPAGAVPKDGPSAGVTMFTALASLLSGRQVRADTAMTGEATLRGRVLPVGGIKAKVLAAHRAGFARVVLPRANERDLEDVPEAVLAALDIVLADDMHEVLAAALEPEREAVGPLEPSPGTSAGDAPTTTAA